MNRRDFLSCLGISLTSAGALSCRRPESLPGRPSILWINCEDIGPALGCYGDPYAITPNIDRLAERGIVYRNAFATAPICAPARSCLVTGLYATSLGTQHLRSEIPVPESLRTLPERLRDAGYFTARYGKTDYNFDAENRWTYLHWNEDLSPWRRREPGQPFFSMFTFGGTHEGSVNIAERYHEHVKDLPQHLFHDPDEAPVPPFYPDVPESRELWARQYDLITALDLRVGELLDGLESDGLMDDTFVFFFSDHGYGLPRFKRWLNNSGLQVPLVIHVPEKYCHMAGKRRGGVSRQWVSFVDFAPTVLSMAGVPVPGTMPGIAFLGPMCCAERQFVYGARSRADNMYEVSRSVRKGEMIYIRHFMPHLAYIQPGFIFSDRKDSFRMLRCLHDQGALPPAAERMWGPKPVEELYDLDRDPHELKNLARDPACTGILRELRERLRQWILRTRDTGFLLEPEMMMRSAGSTPYDMAQDPDQYDLPRILEAAERVGTADAETLAHYLRDRDSSVRFWSTVGLTALGSGAAPHSGALLGALGDESPVVQIAAAEALCRLAAAEAIAQPQAVRDALAVLDRWVVDERPWLALQAARGIEMIGPLAKPLVATLYRVLDRYKAGPDSKTRYLDFNFAAFISWSVKYALHHCGEPVDISG